MHPHHDMGHDKQLESRRRGPLLRVLAAIADATRWISGDVPCILQPSRFLFGGTRTRIVSPTWAKTRKRKCSRASMFRTGSSLLRTLDCILPVSGLVIADFVAAPRYNTSSSATEISYWLVVDDVEIGLLPSLISQPRAIRMHADSV